MSENLFGNQKSDNFDMKVRVIALGGAGWKILKRINSRLSKNMFKDAIALAPELNLKNFDKCVHDFSQWQNAWDDHKSKTFLKVKLKIDSSSI